MRAYSIFHAIPFADRHLCSRKSDIENERLPPELFDPEETTSSIPQSNDDTPTEKYDTPISPVGLQSSLEAAIKNSSMTNSRPSPTSPVSPTSPGGMMPFKRGHSRQASLGTTSTSPSTRRRSMEATISMIQEAMDGVENPAKGGIESLSGVNGNGPGSVGSPRG